VRIDCGQISSQRGQIGRSCLAPYLPFGQRNQPRYPHMRVLLQGDLLGLYQG
jgi:hypothetical protein